MMDRFNAEENKQRSKAEIVELLRRAGENGSLDGWKRRRRKFWRKR